jgi:hypothetical protein
MLLNWQGRIDYCILEMIVYVGFEFSFTRVECSTTWAMPLACFALTGLDHELPVYASFHSWDDRFLCVCVGAAGWGLGFELGASYLQSRCSMTWATPPVYFALIILEIGISQTISPGCPQTTILPFSAFQVARIIGMNHWCLANTWLFISCFAYVGLEPQSLPAE